MGSWKLCANDLGFRQYAALSATAGTDTVKNTADGDPASKWLVAATGATITRTTGGAYTYRGFGIAGSSGLAGAQLVFETYASGAWTTRKTIASGLVPGYDFAWISDTGYSATAVRLVISSAGNPFSIGCVGWLGDYGYNYLGALTNASGYGILALGDVATPGGVRYPIVKGIDSGVVHVQSAGGFIQSQLVRGSSKEIQLALQDMQGARGYAFDKIMQSFFPSVPDDSYTNRGWAKPCWLISDEWTDDANYAADHVIAAPGFSLGYQVHSPSGLVSCSLVFRTLPR